VPTAAYHVRGHTIANEKEHILGLADLVDVADKPAGCGIRAIVAQDRLVLAWLVQSNPTVGLGGNIDEIRSVSILGEEILEPRELQLVRTPLPTL